jgi:hypothetical protein
MGEWERRKERERVWVCASECVWEIKFAIEEWMCVREKMCLWVLKCVRRERVCVCK